MLYALISSFGSIFEPLACLCLVGVILVGVIAGMVDQMVNRN